MQFKSLIFCMGLLTCGGVQALSIVNAETEQVNFRMYEQCDRKSFLWWGSLGFGRTAILDTYVGDRTRVCLGFTVFDLVNMDPKFSYYSVNTQNCEVQVGVKLLPNGIKSNPSFVGHCEAVFVNSN